MRRPSGHGRSRVEVVDASPTPLPRPPSATRRRSMRSSAPDLDRVEPDARRHRNGLPRFVQRGVGGRSLRRGARRAPVRRHRARRGGHRPPLQPLRIAPRAPRSQPGRRSQLLPGDRAVHAQRRVPGALPHDGGRGLAAPDRALRLRVRLQVRGAERRDRALAGAERAPLLPPHQPHEGRAAAPRVPEGAARRRAGRSRPRRGAPRRPSRRPGAAVRGRAVGAVLRAASDVRSPRAGGVAGLQHGVGRAVGAASGRRSGGLGAGGRGRSLREISMREVSGIIASYLADRGWGLPIFDFSPTPEGILKVDLAAQRARRGRGPGQPRGRHDEERSRLSPRGGVPLGDLVVGGGPAARRARGGVHRGRRAARCSIVVISYERRAPMDAVLHAGERGFDAVRLALRRAPRMVESIR